MNIQYTIYTVNIGGVLAKTKVQMHNTRIKDAI